MKLQFVAIGTWRRPAVYGLITALAVAWTLLAGKDVPWDALHYHLYAGFSAVNARLGIDYFPAGTMSYNNPYAHLPLYWMVRANWPSLAIGVTFACLHGVMLWMIYELAHAVSRRPDGTSPATVTVGAVALAAMNPILLQEMGSTFTDITTGTLALGGYVALVKTFFDNRLRWVALGGVLLGAAAALKLSNGVLALLPALPLVWGCVTTTRKRLLSLVVFSTASGVAALLLVAPWAWQLEQAFGNPFFPMMGEVFTPHNNSGAGAVGAANAPAAVGSGALEALMRFFNGMRDPRFLPADLVEAALRPLEMIRPRRLIHTEVMAADARYAALMVLPILAFAGWAARLRSGALVAQVDGFRPLPWLAATFVVAWIIWLAISGNSRYFLPMAGVASVVLLAGTYRALAMWPRVRFYALTTLFGVQGLFLWQATDHRWDAQPWHGPWIQATIPQRLLSEPFLYLPMDKQSHSFLIPLLAPGSSFVGIEVKFASETQFGWHARQLIDRNTDRLRMLKLVMAIEPDGRPIAPEASTFDDPLRRFGLQVDTRDCEYIYYQGNPSVITKEGPRSGPRDRVYLLTCRVVPGPGLTDTDLAGKDIADVVLNRLENECPQLLPAGRSSVRSGSIWRRDYPDLVAWVNDEGLVRFADLLRGGGNVVELGFVKDWLVAPRKLRCWRERGQGRIEISNP